MQKIIVAAKSDNQVIGKENKLVWHLPADLRFFKRTIKGTYLITGRKSYESALGAAIFGAHQPFIVLTRNKDYQPKFGKTATTLETAIQMAAADGAKRLCILGGAAVYKEAMNLADQMILTEVHGDFDGDTFFPTIDSTKWKETSRIRHTKDSENPFDYSFVVYERKAGEKEI